MNEIIKNIYERRAVRKYKDEAVSPEVVDQLLNAGRMAPSALNRQPWRFYVLTDKILINKFDKSISAEADNLFGIAHSGDFLKMQNAVFHGAPVVIFITARKDNEWAALDIGMCAQNIMLAARSMGYDSCPVGLGKFVDKTSLYDLLKVPSSEMVLLSIIIGRGNETPKPHSRKRDNVHYVKANQALPS